MLSELKSNLNIKRESHSPSILSQTWASLQTWNPLNAREALLRKDPGTLPEIYTANLLISVLLQRGLWPFTRITVCWGKGNNQTFLGLLNTGSELTLIPGDLKRHCGPPVIVGAYGGHVINVILAQFWLTVGPVGPQIHPVVFSPVVECIIWISILSSWEISHFGSLICGEKAIMVGKANWKPLELPLPRKIVNQKQYHTPGENAEISTTINDSKDAGVVIPTTSPFNFPIWSVKKTGILEKTVDYFRFNWISTKIAMAISVGVSLFEQIYTSPGTWYIAIDLANAFSDTCQ